MNPNHLPEFPEEDTPLEYPRYTPQLYEGLENPEIRATLERGFAEADIREETRARRNLNIAGGLITDDYPQIEATFGETGGWHVVSIKNSDLVDNGGVTSHRGVLSPGEYVDEQKLSALFEEMFGYSIEQVREVYSRKGGPVSSSLRPLRDSMDKKFAKLADDGGNIDVLVQVTGIVSRTLDYAVARGRALMKEES